jgi:hypothetical protein
MLCNPSEMALLSHVPASPTSCIDRLIASVLLAALLSVVPMPALAASATPRLPCELTPIPAYSPPGSRPSVGVWSERQIAAAWTAPACSGWPSTRPILLVALAASFRFNGSPDDLLSRIGAIGATSGVRYWSVTDKAWRALVIDASALNGPDYDKPRPDFSAAELRSGANLYYAQRDNRSSRAVIYRMRLRQISPALTAIETENITPIAFLVLTPFPPGALRSLLFLEALSPQVWGLYNITWVGPNSSLLGSSEASLINRATAVYRHIAGIPTDQEPP